MINLRDASLQYFSNEQEIETNKREGKWRRDRERQTDEI